MEYGKKPLNFRAKTEIHKEKSNKKDIKKNNKEINKEKNIERTNKKKHISLKSDLERYVVNELSSCIGCNQCMEVCPVSKDPNLTIDKLNEVLLFGEIREKSVYDFIFNCVQCSRCVPVCPPGIRRDLMVLYSRSIAKKFPNNYNSYVRLKTPKLSSSSKILYAVKKQMFRGKMGSLLYNKLDRDPLSLKSADILFYPGCYIYNSEICHKTLAILDYLKDDYEILGGYSHCCGWPQYLQGRLNMAKEYMEKLYNSISIINPKIIITTCAECFAALRKIKAIYKADFIPMSTTEYYYYRKNDLPLKKLDLSVTFHESCHLSRKFNRYEIPRKLLAELTDFKEPINNHDETLCCFYYNFENDRKNKENRVKVVKEIKNETDIMATDCVTCYEVYKEKLGNAGCKIVDFNDLVYQCIQQEKKGEK